MCMPHRLLQRRVLRTDPHRGACCLSIVVPARLNHMHPFSPFKALSNFVPRLNTEAYIVRELCTGAGPCPFLSNTMSFASNGATRRAPFLQQSGQ